MESFRNLVTILMAVGLVFMSWLLYKKSGQLDSLAPIATMERLRMAKVDENALAISHDDLRALYWALRKYGKNDPNDRVMQMLYAYRANTIIFNIKKIYQMPLNFELPLYTPNWPTGNSIN